MKSRIELISLGISIFALGMSITQTYVSWRNRDIQYKAIVFNQRIEIASAVLADIDKTPRLFVAHANKLQSLVAYYKRMLSIKWDYASPRDAALYHAMRLNAEALHEDVLSSSRDIIEATEIKARDLERLYLAFPAEVIHVVKMADDQMPKLEGTDEIFRKLKSQMNILYDDPSRIDTAEVQSALDMADHLKETTSAEADRARKVITDLETQLIHYIRAANLE